jgi:hypothetical protein
MRNLTRSTVVMLALLIPPGIMAIERASAPIPQTGGAPVWQLTYLKAAPGQRDRLERFIVANWFGPDERARQKGYIDGFALLRGSETDSTWDLVVIDIFADVESKEEARERYRTEIMPQHTKQLVDGLDLPSLGRIVGERTTTMVGGRVNARRLGL